jgi:DNA polymerase-3 subunit epsilon
MILLGLDLETTGFDPKECSIIELGYVVWDTDLRCPLHIGSALVNSVLVVPEEATEANGITTPMLAWGVSEVEAFDDLIRTIKKFSPSFFVGHNGRGFDRPFLLHHYKRLYADPPVDLEAIPWIDTMHDLPFDKEPKRRDLNTIALGLGVFNFFQHRAVFDVMTMLTVLDKFPIDKVVENSKEPFLIIRVLVTYNDRQWAKNRGFSWETVGKHTFPKCWVKAIRRRDYNMLADKYHFKIHALKELEPWEL